MKLDVRPELYVNLKECMKKPQVFTFGLNENGECIEEKKHDKGFKQYTLFLEDDNGIKYILPYLFERDIKPIVQELGNETDKWKNNKLKISASIRSYEQDGTKREAYEPKITVYFDIKTETVKNV